MGGLTQPAGAMEQTCVACGAQLGAGPFCGDCGAWNGEGEPPPRRPRPCPVCGTMNRPSNRHCENCAFLLDREPPHPHQASATARLVSIGALVLVGVIAVILVGRVIGGDGDADAPSEVISATDTTPAETSAAAEPASAARRLQPSSVSASSSFSETLGPDNLVDGDPATYWNDASLHGEGAELVFEFDPPVPIERLVVRNVVDETAFRRNYRIRGYEIITDDLPAPVTGELADTQEVQTIPLVTTATTKLTMRVTSAYQAESVEGQAPFEELAVAEVTALGRTEPS